MVRRVVKVAAVVVLLGLLVPQVAEAVAAAFTSASAGVPAVKGTNSAAANGAKGVEGYASGAAGQTYGVIGTAKSSSGYGVFGQNQWGTGPAVGVYGRTPSANGRAVEGYANSTSGSQHFGGAFTALGNGGENPLTGTAGVLGHAKGVLGQVHGVFGKSDSALGNGAFGYAPGEAGWGIYGIGGEQGVHGDGGVTGVQGVGGLDGVSGTSESGIASGGYAVLANEDLGVTGHIVGGGTNVAGTCTVASGETASPTCLFQNPFDGTIGEPIVVLTPTESPGALYWVTLVTDVDDVTGFVVNMASAAGSDITFNFFVVGIDGSIAATAPARAVRRSMKHDRW